MEMGIALGFNRSACAFSLMQALCPYGQLATDYWQLFFRPKLARGDP